MYKIALKDENPQNVAGLSHKCLLHPVLPFLVTEQPLPYWLQNKKHFLTRGY